MTSVQRKFAASLITILIISSTCYTGQTAKQTPADCDGDKELATKLENCLIMKGVKFEKLCITQYHIELVLRAYSDTPVDCKVINAIRECVLRYAMDPGPHYEVNISVASSTPGAPAQSVYKGHVGTGSDPDSMPSCVDVAALVCKGTLSVNSNIVARKVSEDAKQFGVRLDNLHVGVSGCKNGKPYLQVSGIASAPKLSESRVRDIVEFLANEYTGVLRINTENLKVRATYNPKAPPQGGNNSRVK